MNCGCYVDGSRGFSPIIVFCPLHAAAEEMLELLRAVPHYSIAQVIAKAEGRHE